MIKRLTIRLAWAVSFSLTALAIHVIFLAAMGSPALTAKEISQRLMLYVPIAFCIRSLFRFRDSSYSSNAKKES
jgi:hypothetical protein